MPSNDVSINEEKHLPSLVQKTALTQLRADTRGEAQQPAIEYLNIRDLVVRLMEEANEEPEHKGWCDNELSTNEQTRQENTEDVEALHAEVGQLEVSNGKLTLDIKDSQDAHTTVAQAVTILNFDKVDVINTGIEALRGVGGLVLNANGKRFANELGRCNYVTDEMWKNKPPFHLRLNKKAFEEIIWHCKHYTGHDVMKHYPSGDNLAKDMCMSTSVLEATHDACCQAAMKIAKDPDGSSWPAYPSGKSRDEASSKELEAVAKAIEITSSNDASGNEVKHLPNLVQKTALTQVHASTRGETLQLAIEYLQIQGKRLDSRVLSALAVRVSDDPFTKVKKMIKGLIARLMEEANKEAEHKVGTTLICPPMSESETRKLKC